MAAALAARLKSDQISKAELAKKLGVAPQTLTAMINDDWEYITRDAIERVADYLELKASELFKFETADFWKPIREARSCTLLRGSDRGRIRSLDLQIPRYDKEATHVVENFLHDIFPDYNGGILADHQEDEAELLDRASRENCIVIGSPKSNAACEILISKFFHAEPFNGSQANRRKIPFGFCWPDTNALVEKSSLTCSSLAQAETKGKPGIALKGVHVAADYKPGEKFTEWSTAGGKEKYGRDCGLVFVANKAFGAKPVKLIVLAGFSGIGTLAAAKALVRDFRDLEPRDDERCVYGIVEGRYTKAADSHLRKYRDFYWRYRHGGRWPIEGQPANHDGE